MKSQTPEEVRYEVLAREDSLREELDSIRRIARRKLHRIPGYQYIPIPRRRWHQRAMPPVDYAELQPDIPTEQDRRRALALEGVEEDAWLALQKLDERPSKKRLGPAKTKRSPVDVYRRKA